MNINRTRIIIFLFTICTRLWSFVCFCDSDDAGRVVLRAASSLMGLTLHHIAPCWMKNMVRYITGHHSFPLSDAQSCRLLAVQSVFVSVKTCSDVVKHRPPVRVLFWCFHEQTIGAVPRRCGLTMLTTPTDASIPLFPLPKGTLSTRV